MKRSRGDSDHHHEEATPGTAAGGSVSESESHSARHCRDESSDNSGPSESEYDSDMEVSERDKTAAKKTAKEGKKLYNPKKLMGAYRYKTKFDEKWLKKHPDCKGIIVTKLLMCFIFYC